MASKKHLDTSATMKNVLMSDKLSKPHGIYFK